jgi:predicted DNA-binding transcriptional regulator AlpA
VTPAIDDLPPTLNTEQASQLLGVCRGALWAAARDGDAPVEPIRVGRALRWPTRPILDLLGLDTPESGESAARPALALVASESESGGSDAS